jgi:hypothetical protein
MLQRLIPATMTVLMINLLKITPLMALIMTRVHAASGIEVALSLTHRCASKYKTGDAFSIKIE